MLRQNGLKKGTKITSEPIRKQKDIRAISRLLKSRPRDYLLWTLGINNGLFKPTLIKAGLKSGSSCKDTRSSYITNSLDNNERMGFVQKQVGHTTTKMIVEHYYNHIPAADDGNGLEKAFADTIVLDNLAAETTE
jgi:integrase